MPPKILDSTIKKVERVIEKEKELTKTDLLNKTHVNFYSLNKALEILEKEGKIIIIKFERFIKNKRTSHSITIKWKNKK